MNRIAANTSNTELVILSKALLRPTAEGSSTPSREIGGDGDPGGCPDMDRAIADKNGIDAEDNLSSG
jgi:hypothetical protein